MKLAIKGHSTRGRDIIQLLEMLGGRNSNNCTGQYINRIYFINKNGYIESTDDIKLRLYYATHNLEEFEEKFPYKVGNKVQSKGATSCDTVYIIERMRWTNIRIEYQIRPLYDYNHTILITLYAKDLQPYKEETIKESIDKTNKVIFDTQAQSCDIMNAIIKENMEQIEIDIPNGYEFFGINDNNKVVLAKKQPQYPKDFEECAKTMQVQWEWHLNKDYLSSYETKLDYKINRLRMLLICRDAYWKIAGEQMGLGKSWESKWNGVGLPVIIKLRGDIILDLRWNTNAILAFPTEEMRDAFYENFKDLINECKDFI